MDITAKEYTTWQECYQDFIDLHEKHAPTDILIDLVNTATKLGLTYQENPEKYLEMIGYQAALYNQIGDYVRVMNNLEVITQLSDDLPCWVYHDFIKAEMHSPTHLSRILHNPTRFLEDLARDNSQEEDEYLSIRQRNLLKEFFKLAVQYLEKYPEEQIAESLFIQAAEVYDLDQSKEYLSFYASLHPDKTAEESPSQKEEKNSSKVEILDRLNKLQAENDELHQQNDSLTLEKNELSEKVTRLENLKDSLEKQNQENSKTAIKIQSLEQEISRLSVRLNQVCEDNRRLQQRIRSLEREMEVAKSLAPHLMIAEMLRTLAPILAEKVPSLFPDFSVEDNKKKFWFDSECFDPKQLGWEGISEQENFDLYKNLKLILNWNNWNYLCENKKVLPEDKEYYTYLRNVRNHYAHFTHHETRQEQLKDLQLIKLFFEHFSIPSEKRSALREYLEKYSK